MDQPTVQNSEEKPESPKNKKTDSIINYVLWAIVIFCLISLLSHGYSRFRNAQSCMNVVGQLPDFVKTQPVAEEWKSATGDTIDLGYATVTLPAESLESINGRPGSYLTILRLKNGIDLTLNLPIKKNPATTQNTSMESEQNKDETKEPVFRSFEETREIFYAIPKDFTGYFLTKPDKINEELILIQQKAQVPLSQNGIIVFDAKQLNGILLCGNNQYPIMICEVWDALQPVRQTITISNNKQTAFTPQDLAVAKEVIASLRYKQDLPVSIPEIANLYTSAIQRIPDFKVIISKDEFEKFQQEIKKQGMELNMQQGPALPNNLPSLPSTPLNDMKDSPVE